MRPPTYRPSGRRTAPHHRTALDLSPTEMASVLLAGPADRAARLWQRHVLLRLRGRSVMTLLGTVASGRPRGAALPNTQRPRTGGGAATGARGPSGVAPTRSPCWRSRRALAGPGRGDRRRRRDELRRTTGQGRTLAAALGRHGSEPGVAVGILCRNGRAFIQALFARRFGRCRRGVDQHRFPHRRAGDRAGRAPDRNGDL